MSETTQKHSLMNWTYIDLRIYVLWKHLNIVRLYFKLINFSIFFLPQIKLYFTISGLGVRGGAVG